MTSSKHKILRRVILCLVILSFFLAVYLLTREVNATTVAEASVAPRNILITCLDATGYNTDAILLVSIGKSGAITLAQIPRDTYIRTGDTHHKLNHLWYRYYTESKNTSAATQRLCETLSASFGIPIPNAVHLSITSIEQLIDAVGGVSLTIPREMKYQDTSQDLTIDLAAGQHHLTGKEAVEFARYRSGYVTGDLGRLDAQKLLLSALLQKAASLSMTEALPLSRILLSSAVTDLSLPDLISLYRLLSGGVSEVTYLTLPGEAVRFGSDGAWYFALNKKGTEDVMRQRFAGQTAFDPEGIFCGDSEEMTHIYHDTNMRAVTYSDETLSKMKIPFIK